MKRSNAAGAEESALAASKSVGMECVVTSRKNSSLKTISFSKPPGSKVWFGSREYQILASRMKLNLA